MHESTFAWRRALLLSLSMALAVVSIGAQGRGNAANAGDVVRQARTALAHGDVDGARRLAEAATSDAARQALSLALVEIFEGKYAEARTRLLPVASAAPLGDAAVELGILEIEMGRRAEGRRRLAPLLDVRTFAGPDDYFRLARAARASREFLLANDAFQRIDEPAARADIQTEWRRPVPRAPSAGDAVTQLQQGARDSIRRWVPALHRRSPARLPIEQPAASRKALGRRSRSGAQTLPMSGWSPPSSDWTRRTPPARVRRWTSSRPFSRARIEEAALRAAVAYKERRHCGRGRCRGPRARNRPGLSARRTAPPANRRRATIASTTSAALARKADGDRSGGRRFAFRARPRADANRRRAGCAHCARTIVGPRQELGVHEEPAGRARQPR